MSLSIVLVKRSNFFSLCLFGKGHDNKAIKQCVLVDAI